MFTDQDRVYVQQVKATADKSLLIDKVCRFLYAILAMWSGWLLYSDSDNSFNITVLFSFFAVVQTMRLSEGVGTSQYQELVTFLEAKLAEVEVGSEKDSDLNADQSAEQTGQPSS
tara:strand:+ start:169 stop:513 length:345 start_codon:yes stop_codon:yes gene_type:complete